MNAVICCSVDHPCGYHKSQIVFLNIPLNFFLSVSTIRRDNFFSALSSIVILLPSLFSYYSHKIYPLYFVIFPISFPKIIENVKLPKRFICFQ